MLKRTIRSIFICFLSSVTVVGAAQEFPSKPIVMVQPTAAGNSTDPVLHMIGNRFSAAWGKPGIVENRAGAGGIIGTDYAARAAPDGYTLLVGNIGPLAILPAAKQSLPYDPVKSFVAIESIISIPNVLIVSPRVKAKTVAELIEYAKRNPGKLTFATNGVGQSSHLSVELLKIRTGIDVRIIPYKGTPPAVNDVMAGHVDAMFAISGSVLQFVATKSLRALAVTSGERMNLLKDAPTMEEAGVKDFRVESWIGMLAPAGTPQSILTKLGTQIRAALATPEAKTYIESIGAYQMKGGRAEFEAFLAGERTRWADVIKKANIVLD